jgi:hypothetical protein
MFKLSASVSVDAVSDNPRMAPQHSLIYLLALQSYTDIVRYKKSLENGKRPSSNMQYEYGRSIVFFLHPYEALGMPFATHLFSLMGRESQMKRIQEKVRQLDAAIKVLEVQAGAE